MSWETPEGKELNKAWEEIEVGSDRSAAIIGAAFVEDSLQCALESRMRLDEQTFNALFNGPNSSLGSFSSKISLGFALGLYGPLLKKDLNWIREIRNEFAHSMKPITFEYQRMKDLANNLKFLEWNHSNPRIPRIGSQLLSILYNPYIMVLVCLDRCKLC